MQITTRRFDDWHAHFREGTILKTVVPYTASYCGRALAMPNTRPPKLTGANCKDYKREILSAAESTNPDFEPLMTIKLTRSTTPKCIREAHEAGVIAAKAYPVGVTTNAQDGIQDFSKLASVFSAMEEVNMVLPIHGEQPDYSCLSREVAFLPTLYKLVESFPRLRIVMEHLTTRQVIETVKLFPNTVGATITAHHLVLTLDDVISETLQPHNFCLPIAKTADDRQALIDAATSGNPKFFFGSDTAPHSKSEKQKGRGMPGIFAAPVVPQLLAQVFEKAGALGKLENFTSVHGARFYGLPLNKGTIVLEERLFCTPQEINGIVPFLAGQTLGWSVKTE